MKTTTAQRTEGLTNPNAVMKGASPKEKGYLLLYLLRHFARRATAVGYFASFWRVQFSLVCVFSVMPTLEPTLLPSARTTCRTCFGLGVFWSQVTTMASWVTRRHLQRRIHSRTHEENHEQLDATEKLERDDHERLDNIFSKKKKKHSRPR